MDWAFSGGLFARRRAGIGFRCVAPVYRLEVHYVPGVVCAAEWTGRRVLRDDFTGLRITTLVGVPVIVHRPLIL